MISLDFFWRFLWRNATAETERKIGESLVARIGLLYGSNTNSEFAEFLLHRESSASSPHDGNSNKRRREEISWELDDVSPVASKYCFPSAFINLAF